MPKTEKLVVLMNPPYQMQSEAQKGNQANGSVAKSIYHLFVETVIDHLNPRYFSFIIPSKWMVVGNDDFKNRMKEDKKLKKIFHFPGEREVFPTVSIKGGVSYSLWDKEYNGPCEFNAGGATTERYLNEYAIIVQDNNAIGVLKKIKANSKNWVSNSVLSTNPFGLPTNYKNWVESGVPCYTRGKIVKYACIGSHTDKNNIISRWKVALSGATVEGATFNGNVRTYINGGFIVEPGAICTETYIIVNTFDTKEEAENFITYMKTKFFRFMLGIGTVTQRVTKEKFVFVPDITDYFSKWDDEKLNKMFNLTRQQQNYIDSKIKELK